MKINIKMAEPYGYSFKWNGDGYDVTVTAEPDGRPGIKTAREIQVVIPNIEGAEFRVLREVDDEC